MHQRYNRESLGLIDLESPDLSWTFPRLVVFGLGERHYTTRAVPHSSREKPLQFTLYRPISLLTLLGVCMPIHGRGYETTKTISFLGCFYRRLEKGQAPRQIDFDIVRDIVGLTIKSGAYIDRPAYTRDMSSWRPIEDGLGFRLEVQGEGDAPEGEETVKMALAHVKVFMGFKKEARYDLSTRLDLVCSSSLCERFVEMVSLSQYRPSIKH